MPIFRDGEEEQLDKAFSDEPCKADDGKHCMAHGMTGHEGASSAGDLVGKSTRELSSVEKI